MRILGLFERLHMRLSYGRRVDGLWIGSDGGKSDEELVGHVEDALMLIKQHDFARYRRVLRDIRRIWICYLFGAAGGFDPDLNWCKLDRRFVDAFSADIIASTIVHEATHAHPCLRKFGYSEALRDRIERICMRQELAFARRIPDGSTIRGWVEVRLKDAPSFWSDEALARMSSEGALAAARDAGIPEWLAKLLIALGNAHRRLFARKR